MLGIEPRLSVWLLALVSLRVTGSHLEMWDKGVGEEINLLGKYLETSFCWYCYFSPTGVSCHLNWPPTCSFAAKAGFELLILLAFQVL